MTIRRILPSLGLALLLLFIVQESYCQESSGVMGPLSVHSNNPRYFANGSGEAVYLTGAHTWNNLQSNAVYPVLPQKPVRGE